MAVESETAADPQADRVPSPDGGIRNAAGLVLTRITVIPALVALAFLLVSFPLLLLGWFRPVPVLVLAAIAAIVIVPVGWRLVAPHERSRPRTPWWAVAALIVIAAGFGLSQAHYYTQFLIVTRDPASYLQFATWIQRHGSLPISPSPQAFGGMGSGDDKLSFAGWAFYQSGDSVVPQFMAGLPMVLSVGYWLAGLHGALLMAPLLGAAALLTFGGLVARLVGGRWAPVAALALGVTLPQEYATRSTFSEPLSQIMLLGGLCLLIDALRRNEPQARRAARVLAALAGLSLGIAFLVRLDGPSDILLLIPLCGLLLLRRRPQALPLAAGLIVGLLYGAVDGLVLSRPYLHTNMASVRPLTEVFAAAVVVTALAVLVLRRRGVPRIPARLTDVAAFLPLVLLIVFAVRPYVQTNYVKLQDAEYSLHWVYWYAGAPVILAMAIGSGLLIRRCLRGRDQDWLAPILVFGFSITEFLYQPGITPDQPWASRRLVPAVLPGFILFATWFAAWLIQRARDLRLSGRPGVARIGGLLARRGVPSVLAGICVLAMTVPAAKTTFNLKLHTNGGVRLSANGFGTEHLYQGEAKAVDGICSALPPNASVLFADRTQYMAMGQVVRGMCDVPVAGLQHYKSSNVDAVIRRIEQAGRRPVLLASNQKYLKPYPNGVVKEVMALKTRQYEHALGKPPTGSWNLTWDVWMWESK